MNDFRKDIDIRLYLLIISLLLTVLFLNNLGARARRLAEGIHVREIKIDDSRILSESEISELTADYLDKMVTVNQLKQLVAQINDIYSRRGYITARAILPAQTITDGIVRIDLVEGSIADIILQGNEGTDDDYILNRISVDSGDIIKIDTLEDELFYFNAINDINLQVELAAGKEYATTDLKLNVSEPRQHQATLFSDNSGREETGVYRYGAKISDKSLTGVRDSLNLTAFTASGARGGTFSYSRPITKAGTRLVLGYNQNATDIISGEYESVNIEGGYEEYGISLTRPLKVEQGFKMDGTLGYHAKTSDTYFSGVNLLTTDVETYNLGLTTSSIKDNSVWYTYHNLVQGAASSGKKDYEDPGTTERFIKYNAYFNKQYRYENGDLFNFDGYLQITNNKLLPSSEQISIGGMSTIRGYKQGELSGDKGYYLRLKYSKPLLGGGDHFVFIDHGGVYPYKGNEETATSEDYLTGAGLGFNINFTEKISGNFVVGIPLDLENDPRLHFSLQTTW